MSRVAFAIAVSMLQRRPRSVMYVDGLLSVVGDDIVTLGGILLGARFARHLVCQGCNIKHNTSLESASAILIVVCGCIRP